MPIDLDRQLERTSRTFALAIPLLPEPTRQAVAIAYLLLRVADTLEDATTWTVAERIAALQRHLRTLGATGEKRQALAREETAAWAATPPTDVEAERELLSQWPALLESLDALAPAAQRIVTHHVTRTARGMADTLARADGSGRVVLSTVEELRGYCYLVAGIVGELLTELFVHDAPSLRAENETLATTTAAFGEGLQLVNILKDESADAAEGRRWLPERLTRASVLALARRNLEQADRYVRALQRGGAPSGFLAFTGLSLTLAWATLDRLEQHGPGAKVSRAAVAQLLQRLMATIDAGEALECRQLAAAAG